MLIYICDDQPEELSTIQLCLTKAAEELSIACTVKSCLSGEALIHMVEEGALPSLVVLDVYMEGIGGIETGRLLRSFSPNLPLAFLTTSRDFAVDAFELNALHYMVKPVTAKKARTLLERLPVHPGNSVKMLELPDQGGTVRFPVAEIIKIISKSRGVELHFLGRSAVWLPCPFREVEAQLSENLDFLLLGRGCMVDLNQVQGIDYDVCCLKNGERLPISRRERLNVQRRYSDFLFRRLDQMKGDDL